MSVATILQMSDRVSALIEDRLGVRGANLNEKLRRAGRRLPRRVRQSASLLAEAAAMAPNPRLQVRVDESRVAEAYDICVRHLAPIGRAGRLRGHLASIGASIAFALLLVAAGFIAFLVWRGFV